MTNEQLKLIEEQAANNNNYAELSEMMYHALKMFGKNK
jgi:hypothetical protein